MILLASVPPALPAWLLLPFALLLLLIAVMPLAPAGAKSWWEHNYSRVALALAAAVTGYYLLRVEGGGPRLLHSAGEYVSFISLIGALYVVAGGIHLKVKGEATPLVNVVFLFVAAVLANVVGTTGASMVLIRPFIRMNKIRVSAHHVVFFIFLVSNVGGSLTPVGDPPLFLGYLRGVPFFWLPAHVIPAWLFTVGLILGAFYLFDRRSFAHAPAAIRREIAGSHETWRFDGAINVLFLALVIGAVFLPEVGFLRETVMLGAAVASYRLTNTQVHEENHFSFGPIKEVAWLFLGIFVTMVPALDYLEAHGQDFALTRPAHYYFATGALSSVLDNAPTYVNFLKLAEVRTLGAATGTAAGALASEPARMQAFIAREPLTLIAVSLGAVFFGAMTYIGNGPNFMVKSIAHDAGVHTPSFFGYIVKYSLPVLLPILALTAWVFL
ncbi:MAG TPA: sodium:proton antiporter [Lacunisphaera sp.]|jgi:Na+/H+ antiporter NhaD/arsenite permease-like protein|nr:sodium:proton antiporter [Lacunisphaera sp.]